MSSVFFDEQASEELGLLFISATIDTPAAKINKIAVPYSDGYLDLTDYYGTTKYDNRTITINFMVENYKNRIETVNNVINELHGKTKQIKLPSDPEWYYIGRCSVSATEVSNTKKCAVVISADCEPYKKNLNGDKKL